MRWTWAPLPAPSLPRASPCLSAGGVCGGTLWARGRSSKAENEGLWPQFRGFLWLPLLQPMGERGEWGSWVE